MRGPDGLATVNPGQTPPPRREIVEAGAGCGKTTRLVGRYLEALGVDASGAYRPQAHPAQVVALTFTEEAAEQMKTRVLEKLGELGQTDLRNEVLEFSQISTFHSLCYRLLRPHLPALGYADGSGIVAAPVAEALRARFALQFASRFAERRRLLSHLGEREVVESALRLWFSPRLDAAVGAGDFLDHFRKRLEWARAEIAAAAAEFPADVDPRKVTWLSALRNAVHDCDGSAESLARLAVRDINFRTGSKAGKEKYPELLAFARNLRDAVVLRLHLAALPHSLEEDTEAQRLLMRFVRECRSLGPKILDFSALEFELAELLTARGREALAIPAPRVLLVDEFQDTNRTQFGIVEALSGADTEWFFVGDPKQSIYQFRGADVSLFMELGGRLARTELSTNYRSAEKTLAWINTLQAHLFSRGGSNSDPAPQSLSPGREHGEIPGPAVRITWSEDRAERFLTPLLDDLAPRVQSGEECAVLFLSWKRLFEFSERLRERGIPYAVSGSPHHLDHLLSAIFADFLEWHHEPQSTLGLASLLRWIEDFAGLAELRDAIPRRPPRVLAPNRVQAFRARLGLEESDLSLEQILHRFCHWVDPARFAGGRDWAAAMEAFLRELGEQRIDQHFNGAEIARFVRKYAAVSDAESPLQAGARGGAPLRLLTIHGAKGLEFDHVYLPELYCRKARTSGAVAGGEDEGTPVVFDIEFFDPLLKVRRPSILFQLAKREQAAKIESERRRLFYVAVTRSRKTLHLYAPTPGKVAAKNDPLADLFGAPRLPRTFWNLDLAELESVFRASPAFRSETLPSEGAIASALAGSRPGLFEVWKYPQAPRRTFAPRTAGASSGEGTLFRGGVRDYLALEKDPAQFAEVQRRRMSALAAATRALEQADRGKNLHALLEIWSGREESLGKLLDGVPDPELMRSALVALRRVPALTNYWRAAAERSPYLYREMELLIRFPGARLTGVADAALWEGPQRLCLIDWKTGSSLETLGGAERTHSLRRQLEIYAQAFPGWTLRGLGVGVEWPSGPSGSARAEVIFEGALSSPP